MMILVLRRNLVILLVAAVLQGAWEYIACGMYYAVDSIENMSVIMIEATIGDIIITLVIFNLLWIINWDKRWIMDRKDFLVIIIYAFAIAIYFESRALWLERWSYSEEMFTLMDTGIGLVPIVQLIILLPITIMIENLIKYKNK